MEGKTTEEVAVKASVGVGAEIVAVTEDGDHTLLGARSLLDLRSWGYKPN